MAKDLNQIRLSMLALLQVAEEEGVSVARTSMAKLLYFADLKSVHEGGEPESGVTWRWLHHGPYSMAIRDAEKALLTENCIIVDDSGRNESQYAEISIRLKNAPQVEIDIRFREMIRASVREFGSLGATAISAEAYRTYPMLRAQQLSKRGCELDLHDSSFPKPDPRSIRDRVASALARHNDEVEGSEAESGLRVMQDELETLRKRAFSKAI